MIRAEYACGTAGCRDVPDGNAWLVDIANPSHLNRTETTCSKCRKPGRPTGEAIVRDVPVRIAHGERCDGWILDSLRSSKPRRQEKPSDDENRVKREILTAEVQPCMECRPGRYAVWHAGFKTSRWDEDEKAIRVYLEAEMAAGRDAPKQFPNQKWANIAAKVAKG